MQASRQHARIRHGLRAALLQQSLLRRLLPLMLFVKLMAVLLLLLLFLGHKRIRGWAR